MQEEIAERYPAPTRQNPLPEACATMLSLWKNQPYGLVSQDYNHFEQQNPAFAEILHHSACVTWILDLRSCTFNFISSNVQEITGYSPENFFAGGLPFVFSITHPDDLPKTWHLIRKIWDLLLGLPPEKQKHYTFTHDYRQRKADGSQVRILEQCSILQQDSHGHITHVMGICSDITHLKKHETLTASVHCKITNTCLLLTSEPGEQYGPVSLSKRELEIIKLISAGYSSKLIADKLCIEFSTVNTHRQNIIRKTKTKNTGEFVQFAIGNNLI